MSALIYTATESHPTLSMAVDRPSVDERERLLFIGSSSLKLIHLIILSCE
jgi:hypothetical protein